MGGVQHTAYIGLAQDFLLLQIFGNSIFCKSLQPIHLAVIKETPVPRAEVPQPRAVVALGEFRPLPAVLRQHNASRAR